MQDLRTLIDKINSDEEKKFEETVRFNRERRMMDSLAPEKWNELQEAIKKTCPEMAPLDLRHTEELSALVVNRFKDDVPIKTLSLIYDQAIPRIIWKCYPPSKTGSITFSLQASTLFYVMNERVCPLDEIITRLLGCLTG
jgi:hypothetical protein